MTPDPLLRSFCDYLKVEKGLRPLTIQAYQRDLEDFSGFLGSRKRGLAQAKRSDLHDFVARRLADGLEGRSVARRVSALRQFYRYLLLDRMIKADPTVNLEAPKQWKVLPKSLSPGEVEGMIAPTHGEQAKSTQAVALRSRNRAILEVLYAGALRVSELCACRVEDLKLELGMVLVRGKGDKERIVPLGAPAQSALKTYLFESRPALLGGRTSPLLFVGRG
ncbi:MAG: site-specific integrase, partial [Acidobacteria bacterium]|nr:site-specific integrase [Acidobacteriota bacterium]